MPVAPGNRGMRLFMSHITDDMLQAHRQQLFSVSRNGLIGAAQKYVLYCSESWIR